MLFAFAVSVSGQSLAADILYFRDSHSYGGFGVAVDADLRKIMLSGDVTPKVVSQAACGSTTRD